MRLYKVKQMIQFLKWVVKASISLLCREMVELISKLIFDILENMIMQGWMVVEAEQDPAIANC